MKKLFVIILAVLILGAALAPLQAQEARAAKFRTEMVRLKYINFGQVMALIRPYQGPEASLGASKGEDKLFVLRDYPEFVDKILTVIKEIDVKPADIMFTAQLVVGSLAPGDKPDESLLNDPVLKELKGFLPYKSFRQLDANLIRTIDSERAQMTLGKGAEFMLELRPNYTKDGEAEYIQIDLQLLLLKMLFGDDGKAQLAPASEKAQSLIRTTLSIKSGEKTVVGVSKLDGGDKGLILILSAKVIK
jgi:hypothetical protein